MLRLPSFHIRGTALVAAMLAPVVADAQVMRIPRRSQQPLAWLSFSAGLFQSQSVIDGTTQSVWNLGDAVQYRGTVEYAMRGGGALGVAATHARVPFGFAGQGCPPPGGGSSQACGQFDANMSVQSVWGTFNSGGSQGFHGVFDGGLGYTWYRDFESDGGGENLLADMKADRDFSFYFGTGFGYGISPRLRIALVQDFVWVRHQGEGLSNDERTTTQQRVTRLGVRYGYGSRRPGL